MKKMAILTIAMLVMVAVLATVVNANSVASISTDKAKYAQGENVLITITNNCRGPLTISGYVIDNEKNERVFTPNTLAFPIILKPGGSITDVWAQNTDSGDMAVPGIYFVSNEYDSVQIEILAAGPSLELVTDRANYVEGESVLITMTNVGQKDAIICNGYWVEDAKGTVVYNPPMPTYMMPLPPGESIEFIWVQIDNQGNQVAPDSYSVCIQQDRAIITITPAPEIAVSTDSSVYESGVIVTITLTNVGQTDASIYNGFWIEDAKGNVVYTPNMPAFMRPLPPGGSIEFTWDQTDDMGNQVGSGTYFVCIQQGKVTIEIIVPNVMVDNNQDTMTSLESLEMPDHHFVPKPSELRVRI